MHYTKHYNIMVVLHFYIIEYYILLSLYKIDFYMVIQKYSNNTTKTYTMDLVTQPDIYSPLSSDLKYVILTLRNLLLRKQKFWTTAF